MGAVAAGHRRCTWRIPEVGAICQWPLSDVPSNAAKQANVISFTFQSSPRRRRSLMTAKRYSTMAVVINGTPIRIPIPNVQGEKPNSRKYSMQPSPVTAINTAVRTSLLIFRCLILSVIYFSSNGNRAGMLCRFVCFVESKKNTLTLFVSRLILTLFRCWVRGAVAQHAIEDHVAFQCFKCH